MGASETAEVDGAARGRGYATGRATRLAIVEQAATSFAQKGFYGASLRGIARELGVDHTLLLHHFGNKHGLLLAVIEWYDGQHDPAVFAQIAAEAGAGNPDAAELSGAAPRSEAGAEHIDLLGSAVPVDRVVAGGVAGLARGFAAVAKHNAKSPGLIRLLSMLSAEAGGAEHPARETIQRRQDLIIEKYALLIGLVGDSGHAGACVDPEQSPNPSHELTTEEQAVLLMAVWEGLQVFDALHPGRIDLPKLLEAAVHRIV